jgi:hypothetical protein
VPVVIVPRGVGTPEASGARPIAGGQVAGADSVDDLDVLPHGGLPRRFGAVWAPSTPGSFLRASTQRHVRQLESTAWAFKPVAGAEPAVRAMSAG